MQKQIRKWTAAASAGLVLLLPRMLLADDTFSPCWRGNAGTTYESWSFDSSNNPAAPEQFTNPNGVPQATLTVGSFGTGWGTNVLSRTNVWDLGRAGAASFSVPNFGGTSNSWKYVQVQVTYFEDSLAYAAPTVSITGATLVSSQVTNNQTAFPGAWKTMQSLWLMQPAPASETVLVTGSATKGLLLDQVIIDTRCTFPGADVPAFRPCWRGLPGSTFQFWEFGVSNNPAAVPAELVTNSYGTPHASIVLGSFSDGYKEEDPFLGCVQGIWDLGRSGNMSLTIPNNPSASVGSYKYVAVQVTEFRDSIYISNATVSIAGGTLVLKRQQAGVSNNFGGQWITEQTIWRLGPPCPSSELVSIAGATNGTLIDRVVVDTLSLDFACPSDLLVAADAGQCSKSNVTWTVPAVDGCLITNVISTPPEGSTFPVGTNPVSMVIYDGEGGTKTCNFNVIVADSQPPSVVCPANIVAAKDPTNCGAFVVFSPAALDNCPGATVVSVPPSGSLFPLGLTTVTSVAHDAAGNTSAPCSFQVRVIDLNGDIPAFRPCWRGRPNTTFQQWAFSVSNNPASVPAELVTNSYGVPQASIAVGSFSDEYEDGNPFLGCVQGIWDLGQSGSMTLNIPNNSSASPGSYKYVVVQVTQFRDSIYVSNAVVSIAGGVLVHRQQQGGTTNGFGGQWITEESIWRLGPPSPGSETVLISGAASGTLLDQVVVDTLYLDFTCPTDILLSADAGLCSKSNVSWTVPSADGCLVTNVISTPPIGSAFPVGTNPVSVVIQDGEGGSKTCNFTVTVTDDEAPVARCRNITVNLDGTGQAVISGADIDNGSSDNCAIANLVVTPNSFNCSNKGSNAVTLTVIDVHGHSNSCNAVVFVQDVLPPSISCPSNIVVSTDAGQCSKSNLTFLVTSGDNCPGALLAQMAGLPSGSTFPKGITTNTFMATDASGNTATCSFTVTVLDTEAPTITCPSNIVVSTDAGQCSASNVTFLVTSGDNCPGSLVAQTHGLPSGSTFPKGITTNTFVVTDASGNTATCSFTVTVDDGESPTISVVSATEMQPGIVDVKNCANTVLPGTVMISVQASDQCSLSVPTITLTNGSFAAVAQFVNESPAGTFNYTWNVSSNTENGTWAATVAATDGANVTTTTFTLCVNVAQISGAVDMDTFRFGVGYSFNRVVVFTATDTNGATLQTWNVTVSFTNSPSLGIATATYFIGDVPLNTARLSAKTAWSLRRRLAVTLDVNSQGVVNFKGTGKLLGGDLDGSNFVNLGDYNRLAINWLQPVPSADINGDGIVNLADYNILAIDWFLPGDPP